MKRPKFSIGSWAFSFGPFEKQPWPFSDFLEYAAEAGYDGIEINGFHPHPHPDLYSTRQKCLELKKEIAGLGLGISGYAPDFRQVPPALASASAYLKEVEKNLAFCNNLDIQILRIDTISQPVDMRPELYELKFNRLANTWRQAADLCSKAGVLLVWEFEPGFWLNKPSEIKRLVETVGHPNFKLLFDTSHAYMCSVIGARQTGEQETFAGGVTALAQHLQQYIGHLHLIDSDGTLHDNETSTHTPFGEGHIDFKAVIDAIGPTAEALEWWCFDFCFCATTETDARKAIPFVDHIISQLP